MAIHTQRNAFRDLAQYLVLAIPICNCLADRKILIFTIFVMKLNTCGIALTTRNACGSTFDIVIPYTDFAIIFSPHIKHHALFPVHPVTILSRQYTIFAQVLPG